MKTRRGFTMIEVVVVVSCVALLAAVLVPIIGKQVEESKIARAKSDCETIANAMKAFFADFRYWPSYNFSGVESWDYFTVLYSGTAITLPSPYGFASNDGYTDSWCDPTGEQTFDLINNHLVTNTITGGASYGGNANSNANTRWNGPYLAPTDMDPWGHPYLVSLNNKEVWLDFVRIVISAGPNGYIDTEYPILCTSGSTVVLAGDDIGVVFDCGRSNHGSGK